MRYTLPTALAVILEKVPADAITKYLLVIVLESYNTTSLHI